MNHPLRPLPDTPDGGLDDTAKTERPWSSTVSVTLGKPCSAEGARVVVEYVAVDGKDAQALAQRQGTAIREVLEWLCARHSTPPESGQAEAGRPEPPRT
ncbi:hypothetical protein SAMN05428945_6818 [Streptomyces sp. 2224.1]|nr:hypothetical protein SAMN05428945_6818 [Streptomyces sp. 2224.1]